MAVETFVDARIDEMRGVLPLRQRYRAMREETRWSLTAAAVFAVAGVVASIGLYALRIGGLIFFVLAPVAGGVVGYPAWLLVVERREGWSVTRRGAVAGGLAGILAVPMTVGFFGALHAGPHIATPFLGLWGGFIGLIVVGWITVPAGAIAGYLLALRRGEGVTPVWRLVARGLG